MNSLRKTFIALIQCGLGCMLICSNTVSFAQGSVTAGQAWVRPTVPGQEVTGAFMTLQSVQHTKLIKVESEVASTAEIHSMSMRNGVMQMRELKGLDLPAGKQVTLAPGGYHIMLFDVKKRLHEGDTIPLTLTILNGNKTTSILKVTATVGTPK